MKNDRASDGENGREIETEKTVEDESPLSVLQADCEEIIRAGATDADSPTSVSNSTTSNNKNEWKHKVMIGLLTSLFAGEFVLAVTAHCLTERFAMCHTLILVLFSSGKLFATQPRTSVVCLVISLVAAYALAFVNAMDAVHMLIHLHDPDTHPHDSKCNRHESGDHRLDSAVHHIDWTNWLIFVGAADLILKVVNVLMTSGRHIGLDKVSAVLFHLCVPGSVLSVVLLHKFSTDDGVTEHVNFGNLDPALTIVCCAIFALLLVHPMKRNIPILLLAVPEGFSVADFKRDFKKRFPNSDCHELHVYRESDGSFDVSLHIRRIAHIDHNDSASLAEATADVKKTAAEVRSLFARAGAQRVTIQTELVSDAELVDGVECSMKCTDHHECSKMRCCDDHTHPRHRHEHS